MSLEVDKWIKQVSNWTGRSSKSGTGQVYRAILQLDRLIETRKNRVSLKLDRWIKRVWNWRGGSSKSGTGQVG